MQAVVCMMNGILGAAIYAEKSMPMVAATLNYWENRNLRIWLHLLKKFLMENFDFLCSDSFSLFFQFSYMQIVNTLRNH